MGIEQIGVEPDYEVENNPRTFYDGKDEQLEKAIEVLHTWLENEPVLLPKRPG
jgi:tricorn protease